MKITRADGTDELAEKLQIEASQQWQSIRNKIDSLLLSTNALKSSDVQAACRKMDAMTHEERQDYVATTWGSLYLERIGPLLHQLAILEASMASKNG